MLLPRRAVNDDQYVLEKMNNRLSHRGPDAEGYWTDLEAGILLGHKRLAIIDLSEAGAQPMVSRSGRYILAYNGEVYNFAELRRELEGLGIPFRGHSDTEVILSSIEQWGLEAAVQRFNGMFAFALWDRKDRMLSLVRDRMGIKPVFYSYLKDGGIVFGSELKALKAHQQFDSTVRKDVLPLYLRYNYIPDPWTIYAGTFKLQPGRILVLSMADVAAGFDEKIPACSKVYWDAREVAHQGMKSPVCTNDVEALEGLEDVLGRAVSDRLVSDVPLGAFLSGGVDSSTVVALMRETASGTVKTFSIGFSEGQYNEAPHARKVARHLETDHTELLVTPDEAMRVIPLLPEMYDEPYSDYSNIPTFLVSKLARQSVTVSLSGDGGDELFGGYNRHMILPRLWKQLDGIPVSLRRAAARMILMKSPDGWDRIGKLFGAGRGRVPADIGYKLHKLSDSLSSRSAAELYHRLISEWKNPNEVLFHSDKGKQAGGSGCAIPEIIAHSVWDEFPGLSEISMFLDQTHYLPDDILTKIDRASMAVSLEARVPILDHRVVQFAWSLPLELKISNGTGKRPLRNILYKRVPKELIERPKQGFTVPIGPWLQGALKTWAGELIDPIRIEKEGFFNTETVAQLWDEHQAGRRNHDSRLWPLLMFQAWLDAERNPA